VNKYNCWEFMKCGREPEGDRADKLGVCPVSSELLANGLNGGVNGGRLCWIVAENCCNDEQRNPNLRREDCCFQCEFRYKVTQDEGLLNICKATGIFLSNPFNKKE
jgi:hypothetical protein